MIRQLYTCLGVTAHYFDGLELREELLLCSEWDTTERKTAEVVRAFLFRKLSDLQLLESELKHVIFVTDGASNLKKAFTLRNKPLHTRVTCAGHLLNTGIRNCFNSRDNADIQMPADTVPALELRNEIKTLVEHCKRSAISRQLSKTLKQQYTRYRGGHLNQRLNSRNFISLKIDFM